MTKIDMYIPDELIALSQRNPFRYLNVSQDKLEGTREGITLVVVVVKAVAGAVAGAVAAASGGPSSLKSSKL